MLLGHTQVALANTLKGSNPFSDACPIAMDYGRESIVRDDWKKVFEPLFRAAGLGSGPCR